MAAIGSERETTADLRHALARERRDLVHAVESLRESSRAARNLRARLPVAIVGAFGLGFVLSGGIGATMRLLFRRRREGRTRAKLGPYTLVERH